MLPSINNVSHPARAVAKVPQIAPFTLASIANSSNGNVSAIGPPHFRGVTAPISSGALAMTASIVVHAATFWRSCSGRSEEHTSELQSLMRISYAVFCLKKKNHQNKYSDDVNCHHTPPT